jgi:hypothetical protein
LSFAAMAARASAGETASGSAPAATPAPVPAPAAPDGPHGTFEMASLEHEFGDVKAGKPLVHTFKFKNKGKANLEITGVKPSCGCTKGDFDKVVAPGKHGQITLSIAKTDTYAGPTVKTATVTTNDPEHPTLTLVLRANFVGGKPQAASTTH